MAQEKHTDSFCYMDGVRVKVSEKYKPPPKINLGLTYEQRVSQNRELQDNFPVYNFAIERSIRDKIKEWKSARDSLTEERKQVLEKCKADLQNSKKKDAVEVATKMPHADSNRNLVDENVSTMLMPTQAKTQNMITKTSMTISDYSSINISDFIPDTSSPFDNLELKSMDDKEELRKVLENDGVGQYNATTSTANHFPMSHENYSTSLIKNQPFYVAAPYTSDAMNSYYPSTNSVYTSGINGSYVYNKGAAAELVHRMPSVDGYLINGQVEEVNCKFKDVGCSNVAAKSISSIMKSLNDDLVSKRSSGGQNVENKDASVDRLFSALDEQQQALCKDIADMGFPLKSVAYFCKHFEGDRKKIVDHLIVNSEIMELGFEEEKVIKALLTTNNDRDKALELLIS